MRAPYRVIDADGHVAETPAVYDAWAKRMPERYRALAPRHYTTEDGGRHFILEGKIYPPYKDRDHGMSGLRKPAHLWTGREGERDPHKRMPDMDLMGIDVSVLFGSTTAVQTVVEDAGLAAAISTAYNGWISEYCSPYPDKLKGIAVVPVQDPREAAKEVERAAKQGLVGVLFPPIHAEKMPDHKDFFPIYEAAQAADLPICIHNSSAMSPARHLFDNFVLRHAYSTVPLMMAMSTIVVGGVLDAFPRIRFAFLEAGAGWVPYILERMQARYELLPHWVGHLKNSPDDYLRGDQLYFSIEPEEVTVPTVSQIIGEERLVLGSDYSHWDGSAPEAINMVLERSDMSDALKRKILSDNPARLYNL